jgi:hypothetical protein
MSLVLDFCMAFFAAMGFLALLWLAFGRLLTPPPGTASAFVLLPARDDGEDLELAISHLIWLQGGRITRFSIVLVDLGLTEQGRARVLALMEREPGLHCLLPEALPELMKKDG